MSDDGKIMQVMQFTGCTEDVARDALEKGNWDVIDALDRLTNLPKISGSKYIPAKPVVKDHLTPDVREKIIQARQLADLLTYAPQNDLRGKASHYPEKESQELKK
ncbi:hypothetical protein EB118_04710 [bacterium]|nr:hypothetical protein [Actinomycetota bacterium]NDG29387.1 hypothetical protein [bacterium]